MKIRPRSWNTHSKLNGGKNIIVGITFGLIMIMEIGKELGKGKEEIIGI